MSLSLFHLLHLLLYFAYFGNKSHLNGGLNAKLNSLSSDSNSTHSSLVPNRREQPIKAALAL